MRGTLHVTTYIGTGAGDPGRFIVRAGVEANGASHADAAVGQLRANRVARAFEHELNATNLEVVHEYMRHHKGGNIDVVDAARILDRAGVRP